MIECGAFLMGYYIVVGSSRGLGACLVEELLKEGKTVAGVARSPVTQAPNHASWLATGKYSHVELDITSAECADKLRDLKIPSGPLCVIFNAALVMSDVNPDGTMNYATFNAVNHAQIDGFGNVLSAFEKHMLKFGGMWVGISSFSAFTPPVFDPRIAYPASKAYLDMALRCLDSVWDNKIKVVTVHLGHMGEKEGQSLMSRWLVPSYATCAKVIIRGTVAKNCKREINFPFLYCMLYKYLLRAVPQSLYLAFFKFLFRVSGSVKK